MFSSYLTQISPSLKFVIVTGDNSSPQDRAIFSAKGLFDLPETIINSDMQNAPRTD